MSVYTKSNDPINNHHNNHGQNRHHNYHNNSTDQRNNHRHDNKHDYHNNNNNNPKENKTRRVMIHQTDPQAAASILSSGIMRPGSGGALGAAIYFCKTMDGCAMRACHHGTYLMADVYLGKTVANQSFGNTNNPTNFNAVVSGNQLPMYVVQDSDRVKNVRFLDGTIPPGVDVNNITMRDRMPLVYVTTAQNAANIIKQQKIPFENRPDIAGNGIYLWANVPDAQRFQLNGSETYLVAEVYFNNSCYEGDKPSYHDLHRYETFRGNYQGTHYFMIKNPKRIERIHYVGGTRPPNPTV